MKSKVSPELLKKIKDAVNIIEVVGEHVVLRKGGANYTGLCPFHAERSPSFSVSEQKQLYHCYGCKKGGDLVSFVMEINGISFPEAIEDLAERARVGLPQDFSGPDGGAGEDPEARKRREAARAKLQLSYKLNRFAAAFYHHRLSQDPDVTAYVHKRGLGGEAGQELIRSFYLGAAPAGWDALAQHLVAKNAPLDVAVELGLIRRSTREPKRPDEAGYFDLFRNRILFPILDNRGRVAGFGGRALPPGDDGPKYLNSPESPLFQKSKLAYGVYQAQKHIRESDEVVLVEGYFDVLAMHAAGFRNVVATCGTSLTIEHLTMLRRFASKVTLLFDGDSAGINATERAMEIGLAQGQVLHGTTIPDGADPDEVLFDQDTGKTRAEGLEKMKGILGGARPVLDTQIDEAIRGAARGPEERTQALKRVAHWLAMYRDPVGLEVRAQDVCRRLGINRDLLMRAMGGAGGGIVGGAMGGGGYTASLAPVASASPIGPGAPRRQPPMVVPRPAATGPHSLVAPAVYQPVAPARPQNGGSKGRFSAMRRPTGLLTPHERLLLTGVARGGTAAEAINGSRVNLPPGYGLPDLFDYVPAGEWVRTLTGEGVLEGQLAEAGEGLLPEEGVSAETLPEDLDPAVRSTLLEALIGSHEQFTLEDLKVALDHALARVWARFSQKVKEALATAEANKDAGLQAKLMKDYLDVQRRMKEFSKLYDEV